jgi:hypothetical protein
MRQKRGLYGPGGDLFGRVVFLVLVSIVLLPPFACGQDYYFGPYPETHFLNSFYSEETVVYDSALEGTWSDEDVVFEFLPFKDGQSYRLTLKASTNEKGTISIPFIAHLVSIEDQRYLDIQLDEHALTFNDRYLELFLPVHSLWRMNISGDKLILVWMDLGGIFNNSSIWEYLREQPEELDVLNIGLLKDSETPVTERVDYGEESAILITAETRDLQRFIMKHHDDEELLLFDDEFELERVEVKGESN